MPSLLINYSELIMDSILRQGSKGNAVAELQQLLQSKGFYSGKIDGDFGVGTTNAVLKLQKANGLITDGIVGSSSWTALRAVIPASATMLPNALPTLLPGSKGMAVTQAQQLLKVKGYYQGRIDGDFGAVTKEAIAAFQRANGLTVDGKVGEQTWKKLQVPAIADVTSQAPVSQAPVIVIDIVRPPALTSTPSTTSATVTPPSIFVPTSTVTANPIPPANAISLADAANSYSRGKLSNQTAALNNLQANISPEILQQFLQRWQIASGQSTTTTSLPDALSGYNSSQILNQNLALQWLQTQLSSQAIAQFRQDWANLTATVASTSPTPSQSSATPVSGLQLINLTDAVKVYDRNKFPNQVMALEKLQSTLPATTMQQFFQRWSLASDQSAIAISLIDVFKDYDSQKFPSQITALQWLEKELTTANLEQFSQDWLVSV